MTPSQFVATFGPYADQAASALGISRWAILTQWALETGWWTSQNSTVGNNPAGMSTRNPDGSFSLNTYPTIAAGVQSYVAYMTNGYYANVLATGPNNVVATLYALGNSPWASSRYGNPPGSNLVNLWNTSLAPLAAATGAGAATTAGAVQSVTPSSPTPAAVFGPLYVANVHLAAAVGQAWNAPPWASAQGLTGNHLGAPPSIADGANYLAAQMYVLASHVRDYYSAGNRAAVVVKPATVASGDTSPTSALSPAYIGLVDLARSLGGSAATPPWAAAAGLTGEHWGSPPDLATGADWLASEVDGLTALVNTGTQTPSAPASGTGAAAAPPPTASTGGGVQASGTISAGTQPPATPSAGVGAAANPIPGVPPPSFPVSSAPGPGRVGLDTAWSGVRDMLNQTLPNAGAAIAHALSTLPKG